jgi:hypothetical protein
MQHRLTLFRCALVCSLAFGLFPEYIDAAEGEPDDGPWVEVETAPLLPSDLTGVYYLIPYRNRRESWGSSVSLGYAQYVPANYESNFVAESYSDTFKKAPLIELVITVKRNISLGSLGVEVGGGLLQNEANGIKVTSSLRLIPVRVGAVLYMDNLYREPYLVPYGMGGVYTVFYKETLGGIEEGGYTKAAPYYGGGVAFQLNWLDGEAARISYMDSGIENTYLFFEMKKYIRAQSKIDPDFSTGFDWAAGVKTEF